MPELELGSKFISPITPSFHGLENPLDVHQFLQSPQGKILASEINAKINAIYDFEDQLMLDIENRLEEMNSFISMQKIKKIKQIYLEDKYYKAYSNYIDLRHHQQDIQHSHQPKVKQTDNLVDHQPINKSHFFLECIIKNLNFINQKRQELKFQLDVVNQVHNFMNDNQLMLSLSETKKVDKLIKLSTLIEFKKNELRLHSEQNLPLKLDNLNRYAQNELILACLKEYKNFLLGKYNKLAFDRDGFNTSDYTKVTFILKPDQKILKHDGLYYLLNIFQDFNQMSAIDKTQAQLRFEQEKTNLLSLKSCFSNFSSPIKKQLKTTKRLKNELSIHHQKLISLTASLNERLDKNNLNKDEVNKSAASLNPSFTFNRTATYQLLASLHSLRFAKHHMNQTNSINNLNAPNQLIIAGKRFDPETFRYLQRSMFQMFFQPKLFSITPMPSPRPLQANNIDNKYILSTPGMI